MHYYNVALYIFLSTTRLDYSGFNKKPKRKGKNDYACEFDEVFNIGNPVVYFGPTFDARGG